MTLYRSKQVLLESGLQTAGILVGQDGKIDRILTGELLNSCDDLECKRTVFTEMSLFKVTPPATTVPMFQVVDVDDLVIMAGVVDSHVHVNEPGRTDWEGYWSATRAAAAGGVTTIVDMPLYVQGILVESISEGGTMNVLTSMRMCRGSTDVMDTEIYWSSPVQREWLHMRCLVELHSFDHHCEQLADQTESRSRSNARRCSILGRSHTWQPGRSLGTAFITGGSRLLLYDFLAQWRVHLSTRTMVQSSTLDMVEVSPFHNEQLTIRIDLKDLESVSLLQDELRGLVDAGVVGFKCFLCPSGVDEFPHVSLSDVETALHQLQGTSSLLAVTKPITTGPFTSCKGLPSFWLLKKDSSPKLCLSLSVFPTTNYSILFPPQFHAECDLDLEDKERSDDPCQYQTFLNSRPPAMEVEAIRIVTQLCLKYSVRCHIVHLSAAEALPLVHAAKQQGALLTAETCHHYLTLAAEEVPNCATQYKCCPPVRGQLNRDSNLDLPFIDSPVYCESDIIDHYATEVAMDLKEPRYVPKQPPYKSETFQNVSPLAVLGSASRIGETDNSIIKAPITHHRCELLWKALYEGDLDMVVSDHSPCTPDLKKLEQGDFLSAWGGISSLQFGTVISLDEI
uniref:Allantoinase n=1 Tax=Timema tahoe TaxID=61484 RepID=A0A7R9FNK1_9NEOP|nr:unnamed protein product [Timema tahoe]